MTGSNLQSKAWMMERAKLRNDKAEKQKNPMLPAWIPPPPERRAPESSQERASQTGSAGANGDVRAEGFAAG